MHIDNLVFSSIAIVEAPMVYYFLSIIVGMRDCICFANIIGVASLDRVTVQGDSKYFVSDTFFTSHSVVYSIYGMHAIEAKVVFILYN